MADQGIDEADEWFRATYIVVFAGCDKESNKNNRITVNLDNNAWQSDARPIFTMEKKRTAIKTKAATNTLDFEADAGKLYMHNESPWVYL